MGGDPLPKSFVSATAETFQLLFRLARKDDVYRIVAVTRSAPDALLVREGQECTTVKFRDDIIDIFQALKALGDDSAILYDRAFEQGWTATWPDAEAFLEYTVAIDDEP